MYVILLSIEGIYSLQIKTAYGYNPCNYVQLKLILIIVFGYNYFNIRLTPTKMSFLSSGNDNCFCFKCLVNWTVVCKAKEESGLGILNLRNQNLALLGKWISIALSTPNLIWVKRISSRYFKRTKLYYLHRQHS